MTNTYEVLNTKQLTSMASGLTKSVKGLNSRLQVFVGSFVISYNDNKDNNPFNNLMQALASEDGFTKTKTKIINWINATTNYKVKWVKESNYFGITYKDSNDKVLKVNEEFYTTCFYDKTESEENEKDNTKYESIDKGLKSFDKTWEKLYNTATNSSDKKQIKERLERFLAIISA